MLDEQGQPISGFNVTSSSGANYLNDFASAVPELEAYIMLLAGLGFIGLITRRRKRIA
jgi:hypothetical protein